MSKMSQILINEWLDEISKVFYQQFRSFSRFCYLGFSFHLAAFFVYGTRSSSNVQKNLDYTEMQLRSILQSRSFHGNYLVDAIKD